MKKSLFIALAFCATIQAVAAIGPRSVSQHVVTQYGGFNPTHGSSYVCWLPYPDPIEMGARVHGTLSGHLLSVSRSIVHHFVNAHPGTTTLNIQVYARSEGNIPPTAAATLTAGHFSNYTETCGLGFGWWDRPTNLWAETVPLYRGSGWNGLVYTCSIPLDGSLQHIIVGFDTVDLRPENVWPPIKLDSSQNAAYAFSIQLWLRVWVS